MTRSTLPTSVFCDGKDKPSYCIDCHRQLKKPSPTGRGPVCERKAKAKPVPAYEPDLLPYDVENGIHAARYLVQVHIKQMAADAYMDVRDGFRAARERLLGWEVRNAKA